MVFLLQENVQNLPHMRTLLAGLHPFHSFALQLGVPEFREETHNKPRAVLLALHDLVKGIRWNNKKFRFLHIDKGIVLQSHSDLSKEGVLNLKKGMLLVFGKQALPVAADHPGPEDPAIHNGIGDGHIDLGRKLDNAVESAAWREHVQIRLLYFESEIRRIKENCKKCA